jgi:hypothetical protein
LVGDIASGIGTGIGVFNLVTFEVFDTQPDLVATGLSIHGNTVNFSWSIDNADLPAATTVGLYWSDDATFDAGDTLATSVAITGADAAIGTHASMLTLDARPPLTTTHVILVADPPAAGSPNGIIDESDESNNELATSIPSDINARILRTEPEHANIYSPKTLISFLYDINYNDLPNDTAFSLYWSHDSSFDASDSLAYSFPLTGGDLVVGTTNGTISSQNLFASWTNLNAGDPRPPFGTRYLLLVLDPANTNTEFDETNNVVALAIPPSLGSPGSSDGGEDPVGGRFPDLDRLLERLRRIRFPQPVQPFPPGRVFSILTFNVTPVAAMSQSPDDSSFGFPANDHAFAGDLDWLLLGPLTTLTADKLLAVA